MKEQKRKLLCIQNLPPSDDNLVQERTIQLDLNRLLYIDDLYWCQRAKRNWSLEGDYNSRFFHLSCLKRRRSNRITSTKDTAGISTSDENQIASIFIKYFLDLFCTTDACSAEFIQPHIAHQFSAEEILYLTEIPTNAEIKSAVFSIGSLKSPGFDGFNSHFFKTCWTIIAQEFCDFIRNFFVTNEMPNNINHTLLVLLPKTNTANSPDDFRPISLCTVLYKTISKVLATRKKLFLHQCISKYQSAFILSRNISDNCILAQELFHSMQRSTRSEGLVALKLDLSKAYDRVDWNFLVNMLTLFGFPQVFITWIYQCISTASYSVLINGQQHGYITPSRGIRQGCPLSPYLFVFVMEYLSRSLEALTRRHLFSGIQLGRGGEWISHLCYVDDILIFSSGDLFQLGVLK